MPICFLSCNNRSDSQLVPQINMSVIYLYSTARSPIIFKNEQTSLFQNGSEGDTNEVWEIWEVFSPRILGKMVLLYMTGKTTTFLMLNLLCII